MNWDIVIQTLLSILATLGGAGVVLFALLSWLGKIWENTISVRLASRQNKELEDLKNEYAKDLEKLRSDLTQYRDIASNTSNILSSGYMASHPHIVDAIINLWEAILEIDHIAYQFIFPYSVLLPDEIENKKPNKLYEKLPLPPQNEFVKRMGAVENIEGKRPFLGENLWLMFYVYKTFAFRLCWKVWEGVEKGKVYSWDKTVEGKRDEVFFNGLLTVVFNENELKTLTSNNIGTPQRILNGIKSKILAEMNELIFGHRVITMSFEEQQRLNTLIESSGLFAMKK